MEQEHPGAEEVRRRLKEILAQHGKLKERDLLRVSAITGVDYFTVARLSRELTGGATPGAGKDR